MHAQLHSGKTAFYANRLLFFDEALAEEFIQKFPQYEADLAISKLALQLRDLEEKLETKLARGAYDLSR